MAWTRTCFFALGGDLDAARELVEKVGPELAELFVYPGDPAPVHRHLAAVVRPARALAVRRSREFVDRVS
jgi:hypothetical protein